MNWRNFYGTWMMRVGELSGIISVCTTGLTVSWVIQNILRNTFKWDVSLVIIIMTGIILVMVGAYFIDKLGLIGAKEEAQWQRNKYSKSLTEVKE